MPLFLSPWFLLGALVAALPIVLHLAGRRPEARVEFAAVRLLKRAPAEATRRRRLRELLLLALRVSGVVLLAVAFARPYLLSAVPRERESVVMVAVDRSFSMSAPGRFAAARAQARRAVASAPATARVGLMAFDDDAEVLVAPTRDRGRVAAALDGIEPGFGGTAYGAALARASDAIGDSPGRIDVITDLERGGWHGDEVALPRSVQVSVQDAGAPQGNLSVTELRRADTGLAATLHNYGATRRDGRVTWAIDGRTVRVARFTVEAGATQALACPMALPPTGRATVAIEDATGYAADNQAYALLDPPDVPALLAVTAPDGPSRGAFFVERALAVDGGKLFHLDTQEAARFPAGGAQELRRYQAVLLLGTRGLTREALGVLASRVDQGAGLLVALGDGTDPAALGALVPGVASTSPVPSGREALLVADVRHPLFTPLGPDGFGGVVVMRAASLTVPQGASVLARLADGRPALVETRRGAGRVLLFASDLGNEGNDLPLQPAFLPFIHQAARYLIGDRTGSREFVVGSAPRGVARQPGFAMLPSSETGGGPASGRIVINVDPRESTIDRMTPAEFAAEVARTGAAGPRDPVVGPAESEQRQGWWRMVWAAALAALLVEALLGRVQKAWA